MTEYTQDEIRKMSEKEFSNIFKANTSVSIKHNDGRVFQGRILNIELAQWLNPNNPARIGILDEVISVLFINKIIVD